MNEKEKIYYLNKIKEMLKRGGITITVIALLITLNGCHKKDNKKEDSLVIEYIYTDKEDEYYLYYQIKENDNLESIANTYNTSVDKIIKLNNINNENIIIINTYIKIPINKDIIDEYDLIMYEYIVKEGDNLTSIANKFDITIEEILKVNNNIINENQINKGDIIKIPNTYIEQIEPPKLQDGLLRGIDISELNGNLDWNIINEYYKKGHIDFIIIRLAENWNSDTNKREFTLDSKFEENLAKCNEYDIPYGVYVFSRAETEERVYQETSAVIEYLNKLPKRGIEFNPSLPIYMDCFEDNAKTQLELFQTNPIEAARLVDIWCQNIENAGYFVGIYCNNKNIYEKGLNTLLNNKYTFWTAGYYDTNVIEVSYQIYNWDKELDNTRINAQVSDKGIIEDLNTYFDINICKEELITMVRNYYGYDNNRVFKRTK